MAAAVLSLDDETVGGEVLRFDIELFGDTVLVAAETTGETVEPAWPAETPPRIALMAAAVLDSADDSFDSALCNTLLASGLKPGICEVAS